MALRPKNTPRKISSADFFVRLLLIIFSVEMLEMWTYGKMFDHLDTVPAALADSVMLVLFSAPFVWLLVIRPMGGENEAAWKAPLTAPAGMFIKVLTVIFMTEFLVMLVLPFFFDREDHLVHYFTDATLTTFVSVPLLWWIFSREQRSRIDSLADLLGSPLKLYLMLLGLIFLIDLVDMPLVAYLSSGKTVIVQKVIDSSLVTLLISPLLWWLVIRPLRRVALSEKTRADAIRAQVVEAIVIIDAEGKVESFNPAAETIFGYTA
ncbi:MAG: PAS domain S-box protein, partial [Geobacter sp.]